MKRHKRKNQFNKKLEKLDKRDLISLIKDELVYIRLINGLETLGLNADNYHINLNEIIFKLAGINTSNEDFFERYMTECRTINGLDIFKYPELLNDMAFRLYRELKKEYKTQNDEK